MARTNDSRERMVLSAAILMGRQGVAATGFRDVVAHSGTSRGGLSHHFPAGKAEMIADATRLAGDRADEAIAQALESGGPAAAIRAVCGLYRHALTASDYTAGCPVGAAAAEAHQDPRIRQAAADTFARWSDRLRAVFAASELDDPGDLAAVCISAIEGALLVCRVEGSTRALDAVERQLLALVAA